MTASAQTKPMPLTLFPRGKSATVSYLADAQFAGRLMAMGVLPGSHVEVLRSAPFGGGFYIKADNLLIALRNEEAELIFVS